MSPELKVYEEKMNKTINVMTSEFASIRAGRANPAVLDKVFVDYYGTPTKITQMASVSVSEARVLVIQPYDKSTLKSIEKAIQTSDIGINPSNDGSVIRMTFPQLTEERRKEIVKQVSKQAEESKVAIRSIRRDANDRFKAMKKNGEATEDDVKSLENQMQKLTDKFIDEIDKLAAAKEKEILAI
jgi:ribosome recycling factor